MGLEVSEGLVSTVNVAVGDAVAEGDTLVEVETDKAIAEVPSPRDGVVAAIAVEVGETIEVGAVLVRVADSADEIDGGGEAPGAAPEPADPSAASGSQPATEPETALEPEPVPAVETGSSAASAPEPARAPEPVGATAAAANGNPANGAHRLLAAPLARRAAAELGVVLERIAGSGPRGRITLGDVEKAAAEGPSKAPAAATRGAAPAPAAGERLEALSATRQSIARHLAESQLVPSYTLSRDVDVAWLLAEKKRLSESGPAKIGVVDLLLAGIAATLERHPALAASFVPGRDGAAPQLRHPGQIDLGLAVATERGLLVPVLRDVLAKTLPEMALERSRLIGLTREGRLGMADMGGAAATLSSLGTFGVDSFTAMLNPGESAILAVGRTFEKVVPRDRGLAVVPTMSMTFTFDHRVVDGATGAAALSELAELLEGSIEWRT
jgi:pyruvate dehydrogenase E2 component (dihydrolipoamide acetyltransferase)